MTPTNSILHRASSKKLSILCGSTHERANSVLARTGHTFYAIRPDPSFKKWDNRYGIMPENWIEISEIKSWMDFDAVLVQHRFGQYQYLAPIAHQLQLPIILLEHTTKMPWWDVNTLKQINSMRGHVNVFITDHSVKAWEWEDRADTFIIKHGVDIKLFKPDPSKERKNQVLVVANDYIGRDSVLNFKQFQRVTTGLPVKIVGDTPRLSLPANNLGELIHEYQTSRIFLNTAHLSPIPSVILESMACSCVPVSCDTCGISEFITNGEDGFLCKTDKDMREKLELLLNDPDLAEEMGKKARETIIKKCNIDRFCYEWNSVLAMVTEK